MLKAVVTTAPMLLQPSPDNPYHIEADTLGYACGAVLSQLDMEGQWHPVAFLLWSFSSSKRNYDIHDKELLAVIQALEEWHHLLEGARHQVEIFTDHLNLMY